MECESITIHKKITNMKKKKNKTEKALALTAALKANVEFLKEKGQEVEFVKTLDMTVRKLIKQEKEIGILKTKIKIKKDLLEQEKAQTQELVKNAKKILKNYPEIKLNNTKNDQKKPTEKVNENNSESIITL